MAEGRTFSITATVTGAEWAAVMGAAQAVGAIPSTFSAVAILTFAVEVLENEEARDVVRRTCEERSRHYTRGSRAGRAVGEQPAARS